MNSKVAYLQPYCSWDGKFFGFEAKHTRMWNEFNGLFGSLKKEGE